jgi:uncharacterized protein Usg
MGARKFWHSWDMSANACPRSTSDLVRDLEQCRDGKVKQPWVSTEFHRQLEGYGLTTANILYRRPDHPWLLQTYVWQDYDLCPRFPQLNKFLNFWLEKLEGPLHSVTVAHARLIKPAEIRAIDGEFKLN